MVTQFLEFLSKTGKYAFGVVLLFLCRLQTDLILTYDQKLRFC